jgi:hypothetical protein
MFLSNLAAAALNLALFACVNAPTAADGHDQPDNRDKSRAALDAWLERFPNVPKTKDEGLTVVAVDDEAVRRIFPRERFYGVYFYVGYPRPGKLPAELRTHNLIQVQADGAVERIGERESLSALFEKKIPPARDEAQARAATAACIRVAEEFYQDGLYKFHDSEVKVTRQTSDLVAVGRTAVKSRGTGTVSVTLMFKPSGEVHSVTIEGRVRPDARLR